MLWKNAGYLFLLRKIVLKLQRFCCLKDTWQEFWLFKHNYHDLMCKWPHTTMSNYIPHNGHIRVLAHKPTWSLKNSFSLSCKITWCLFVLQFRNSDSDIIEIQMKFRTRLVRNRSGQTMWRWKDLFKRMKFALLKPFKESII